MRIGYFPDFKGYDAILIDCDHADIEALRAVALEAVVSQSAVSVHARCVVRESVPLQLHLFAAPSAIRLASAELRFVWRVDPAMHSSIDGLLEGFTGSSHQFLDLDGENAVLIVSVGEYDDNWWQTHGKPRV